MKALDKLPRNAPAGTRVLVSLDEHVIAETTTRSEPWSIADGALWLVMLEGRSGGYNVDRCFIFPASVMLLPTEPVNERGSLGVLA